MAKGNPSGKIDPGIIDMLKASGRVWSADFGQKHIKLKVEGRVIVVLPLIYKNDGNRAGMNARAAVKRHLKTLGGSNDGKTMSA